jgi:Ca-activated chloride channel family protein
MDNTEAWYAPSWFFRSTFDSYTWANPDFLWLLAALPLFFIVRWLVRHFTNQRLPVALVKSDIKSTPLTGLRFVPDVLLLVSAALIAVALARPQRSNEKVEQYTEGIDIMLAIDISQSMQIEDFVPNRLAAAKQVARNFIAGRRQDRIGIVVFSGDAFSLAPLTTDYDLLNAYINEMDFDMIENRGTAIGSALSVVINRMRESESKSKVCILLSDGESNAGNIDPITAAELAGAYGITIYTIIVGKEGLVPFGKDFFGRPQMVENEIDESSMRRIAEIGKGEFFRAEDARALESVFDQIDRYEKAEIKETRYKDTTDFYTVYLRWAIVFFLGWLLLKSTFLINVLQD